MHIYVYTYIHYIYIFTRGKKLGLRKREGKSTNLRPEKERKREGVHQGVRKHKREGPKKTRAQLYATIVTIAQ